MIWVSATAVIIMLAALGVVICTPPTEYTGEFGDNRSGNDDLWSDFP